MLSWFTVYLSCRPLDRLPYAAGTLTRPVSTSATVWAVMTSPALRSGVDFASRITRSR